MVTPTVSRLPREVLAHSFRFLGRQMQLSLREVCPKFQELVDETLVPEWSVVIRLTSALHSSSEQKAVRESLWLACSGRRLSVHGEEGCFEDLLRIGTDKSTKSPSSIFTYLTLLPKLSFILSLTSLDVRSNQIDPAGMRAFAASSFFPKLTSGIGDVETVAAPTQEN